MKKIISTMFMFILVMVVVGCANNNTTQTTTAARETEITTSANTNTSSVVTTLMDNTTYLDITYAPKYEVIDETNYVSIYFDSENGDDLNDGLSQNSPKKTIEEANKVVKKVKQTEPTKLLFKGTFKGTLELSQYSSSEKKPLIVSSYGNSKAVFDGDGNDSAILVSGGDLRIYNLEVTNSGRVGIYVYTNGIYKNLVIEGCYIHNVNWNWTFDESEESYNTHLNDLGLNGVKTVDPTYIYETGGIIFNTGMSTISYLENVWVKDNRIEKVSRSGIFMTSQWVRKIGVSWGCNPYCDDEHGYYPSRNVNYVGNYVDMSGGDGLVMIGVDTGYFESNVSYNANFLGRTSSANAGMWPISSKNIVMQFNESAYCKLKNGGNDGEGFDIDIGCKNILFQYNYSHDNDGPGLLLCNTGGTISLYDEEGNLIKEKGKIVQVDDRADWSNVIVRNSIFVNNGLCDRPTLFHVAGSCYDLLFENNTVIYTDVKNQPLMNITMWDEKYKKANNFTFKNNIFYSPSENNSVFSMDCLGDDYLFVGNLYFNISENQIESVNDSKAYTFDPGFTKLTGEMGYENVELFTPTNINCYKNGLRLSIKNKYDILMNLTYNTQYLGAIAKK